MSLVDYKEKKGVPVLVSEKFAFEKGIYSSKIQHILDLSLSFKFPIAANMVIIMTMDR